MCAVFMLSYSLNCKRTRRTRGRKKGMGEWKRRRGRRRRGRRRRMVNGYFCTLPCDVVIGMCCTLLFLLRVKVAGPLPLSH